MSAGPALDAVQIPLAFEANRGQTDDSVDFLARGNGYAFYLTPGGAVASFRPAGSDQAEVLKMDLVGGNASAAPRGLSLLPGTSNYFLGNDPTRWRSAVPNYGRVEYQSVYPGVDVAYYGSQGQVEYDFLVAAGADPGAIRMGFSGAKGLSLNAQGDLVVSMAAGDIVEHAPVVYQEVGGVRREVSASYALLGGGQVGFRLGSYDRSLPLVIDPVLSFSTFLGGSLGDKAFAVATDASGNVYITGETGSADFPSTPGVFQPTNKGSNTVTDVFVTKLNASGQLVYSTFLGGFSDDHGTGIAVDSQGNAYICGWTTQSPDYPTTAGSFQPDYNHRMDGFVTKLNANGTALLYSTYLGGTSDDEPHAIAVDDQGSAYVVGDTISTNFPTQNPIQGGTSNTNDDAFLSKLSPDGSALVYSTYIRGSLDDAGTGVAVTPSREAIVVGYTKSTNFPTTANAFQKTRGGNQAQSVGNTFVTKVNAAGNAYVYSTYLGGSIGTLFDVSNGGPAVATDASGNAYVAGDTFDPDFPVTPDAAQQTKNFTDKFGLADAFVAKFAPAGGLVYSTYLGGGGNNTYDAARAIAVDAQGNAYVTGFTADTGVPFPIRFPIQTTPGQAASFNKPGDFDAFLTRVSADGSTFDYSSYLGGVTYDYGRGVALDGNGNAFVVGLTRSTAKAGGGTASTYPTLNAIKATPPSATIGDTDGFVSRVNPQEPGAGKFYFPYVTTETTDAGSFVTVQVARRDGVAVAATVAYATSDGTAKAGTNYTATSGTLSFAAGERVKTFTVPIRNDGVNKSAAFLTFKLTLSNATGGATIDTSAATEDVRVYDAQTTRTNNDVFDNALPLVGSSPTAAGSNVGATTNTGGNDIFDYPVTDKSVTSPKNDGGASVWWLWSPPATGVTTIDTFGSNFDTLLSVFSNDSHMVQNDDAAGRTDGASQVTFLARAGQVYRICVQGYASGGGVARGNIALHVNGAASAGTAQLGQQSYTVFEDAGSVAVQVSRAGGSAGAVSVQFSTVDGTAKAGSDYTAVSQTLTWASGDTASKTVTIPILNNHDSLSETFDVQLSNPSGGLTIGSPSDAVVVILIPVVNTPVIQFSAATYSVVEGGGVATITATRTGSSTGAVSVSYATSDGTATAGSDYTAASGTLSWGSGDTASKTFTIPVSADGQPEGAETVNLTLSSPTGGATLGSQSTAVLTIKDPPGTLQLSATGYTVAENGGTATVTVTRTVGSGGAVSVKYATADGTAKAGSDYTSTAGTLNFAEGQTSATITVPILSDSTPDTNETFTVTLSAPTGATLGSPASGVVTIQDGPGTVQFSASGFNVKERAGLATVTVSRAVGNGGAVSIQYATSDGTAKADTDYTATTGTLNFADGQTSATFTIPIVIDATKEGPETVNLTLSSPGGGATLGTQSTAVLTITELVPPRADYDGDGKSDFGFYNPAAATYTEILSGSGKTVTTKSFGGAGWVATSGDYDGDGKTDLGLYNASAGTFVVVPSAGGKALTVTKMGSAGAQPLSGDYDGDGKTDFGYYLPSKGIFSVVGSKTTKVSTFTGFGGVGWEATAGDYDGDGKTDVGIYRAGSGTFTVLPSTGAKTISLTNFGTTGSQPLVGDYDGDGKTDFGYYKTTTATLVYVSSKTGKSTSVASFGGSGWVATAGDYDGDGRTDVGRYRPANGSFVVVPSAGGAALTRNGLGTGKSLPLGVPPRPSGIVPFSLTVQAAAAVSASSVPFAAVAPRTAGSADLGGTASALSAKGRRAFAGDLRPVSRPAVALTSTENALGPRARAR